MNQNQGVGDPERAARLSSVKPSAVIRKPASETWEDLGEGTQYISAYCFSTLILVWILLFLSKLIVMSRVSICQISTVPPGCGVEVSHHALPPLALRIAFCGFPLLHLGKLEVGKATSRFQSHGPKTDFTLTCNKAKLSFLPIPFLSLLCTTWKNAGLCFPSTLCLWNSVVLEMVLTSWLSRQWLRATH